MYTECTYEKLFKLLELTLLECRRPFPVHCTINGQVTKGTSPSREYNHEILSYVKTINKNRNICYCFL